jgi:ribosomal protein L11 methyltransferase
VKWIEFSLIVDADVADAVAAQLQSLSHQGVSLEQVGLMPECWDDGEVPPPEQFCVRAYVADDARAHDRIVNMRTALGQLEVPVPLPEPLIGHVAEEDWAEAWKAHYHPLRLGKHLFIHPPWIEVIPEPDDIVISMDPGMAFGTGTHPSTQLCLESLEEHVVHGLRVLDLGCGSGILSIAAAKLGAAYVLAIDNDPLAVAATTRNAIANGVSGQITALTGSLETVIHSARRFDLIVVNILARIIIEMCESGLGQTVRPGGKAIFSGLIEEQAEAVETALRATGLIPFHRRTDGDWVAIEAYRPHA